MQSGKCYVVKDSNHNYKIGQTKNLKRRIHRFDALSPYEITPVITVISPYYKRIENNLHQLFAEKRIRGEWFNLCDDDLMTILGYFLVWSAKIDVFENAGIESLNLFMAELAS